MNLQKIVIPLVRVRALQRENGNPEEFYLPKKTGFLLPNDRESTYQTFYKTIKSYFPLSFVFEKV